MQYVIGIDGGGTKTLAKIADSKGNLLGICEGGPSNIYSSGEHQVFEVISRLLSDLLQKINAEPSGCLALCMGSAGAGRSKGREALQEIIRQTGISGDIIVTDDAQTALFGGVGGSEGIIAVSGTGSICYGRNAEGMTHRAGGWGHIIGDEGSGYYIGREIFTSILKSHDGRGDETLLTSIVLENLKVSGVDELIEYVYSAGTGKKQIAELARMADDACLGGDSTAEGILKKAAVELFACASAVVRKLEFDKKPVKLAVSGSILTKSLYVREEFVRLVKEAYPEAAVMDAKYDAAWGAVLMALDRLGRKR